MDAWIEMTKNTYANTYAGRERSYYRVSSSLYDIDLSKPSIVYIRFKTNDSYVDYIDVRKGGSVEWYNRR